MRGPSVQTMPAIVGNVPGGAALHARIAGLNGASTLGAQVTIPSWVPSGTIDTVYPQSVLLQVESGQAGTARATVDGQAASATLGIEIAVAPQATRLPYSDCIRNDATGLSNTAAHPKIALFTTGALNLQVLFEP